MKDAPIGMIYGPYKFTRNYRCVGQKAWEERVLLRNRDDFDRIEYVGADAPSCRIPRKIHIGALDMLDPMASVTQEIMNFVRTAERSPDGLAIYREFGFDA